MTRPGSFTTFVGIWLKRLAFIVWASTVGTIAVMLLDSHSFYVLADNSGHYETLEVSGLWRFSARVGQVVYVSYDKIWVSRSMDVSLLDVRGSVKSSPKVRMIWRDFLYVQATNVTRDRGTSDLELAAPLWAIEVILILSVIPMVPSWIRHHRESQRRADGLCVDCGYDLRASTERCPECETAIATVPVACGVADQKGLSTR